MKAAEINLVLERQLLLQFGDRLKRLRQIQGVGTVEMAARVGITRNTLRSVETGDPSPSFGTYLRVMSVLGVGAELALLASNVMESSLSRPAAARSRRETPGVQVQVSAGDALHRLQDLQSMALHEEAVRLAKVDPALVQRANATATRWLQAGESRSAELWREWLDILRDRTWRKVLSSTQRAQQLRQASPLVTVLPKEVRLRVLEQVKRLRTGVNE
ncbi:helix-turn-helix transcriptional regulator [Rhizobacter sp. Root16D2]|uniref:helix-turn-helix transcriptional regulator n=1 Tax=Rhizobacter sp. Root16D2 TaxID=1736479 RepID=UPI0009EB658B|nr:helix-turn-helix transcriptional regulator [Rhizobacter sp. Root16D2]